MLTEEQQHNLLQRFPKIKLCYEKMVYNKVNSDYYLAAPYGRKVFIWFTYLNRKNVCILMEITSKRNCNISDIKILNIDFDWELSYGTILYGTRIISKKMEIISIFKICI